ncbi:MAG TPA: phosphate ABC transporter substrate-binding/OmpA family protein [Symbiobacteriaceae bacterium]|nr:phosphate ABC transporter substrate-binding/OmpA family protein [Symbiobacteriaceae bacterium]
MKIKWGNILAFLLIIVGVVGYFQWETIQGYLNKQKTTSVPTSVDSVIYARDTWITGGIPELGIARGYHRDYDLELTQAYYPSDTDRLAALGSGKAHFSEMSWPSLLFNLEQADKGKYQDQIVVLGFIDYSRGGDGLIVHKDIKTVNDLLNKRVGYVGDGTGKYLLSFLLRMVDMRFEDVKATAYDDENVMTADFAQGKLDAIAYWQPGMNDVLRQVSGSKVLLSTADMPTLIPDVLIANRKYVAEHGDKAEAFLKFWFFTVKHIQERPDMAFDRWAGALNAATYTEGGKQEPIYGADNTAAGLKEIFSKEVRLVGFDENLKLMGISQPPEIEQMVKFAVENWKRVEKLNGPDAAALVNNRVLDGIKGDVTLKVGAVDASKTGLQTVEEEKPKEFNKAADPGQLSEVAQMAIPNIEFEPDATTITPAGRKVINDVVVPLLKQFPNFYLLVDGHTDVGGDQAVLQKLSLGRAQSVKAELVKLGFPDAQVVVRGFGDTKPLYADPKTDLEKAKNRRTEFRLLRDQ